MKKAKGGKVMPYGKPMMDDKKAAGKGKAAMPMKKGKKK